MQTGFATKVQSVSELSSSIKGLLESSFSFVAVAGEISNLRRPLSGHYYFTLKDEGAQIRSVLFKLQQRYLPAPPEDGRQVVCRGRLSLYEPRGEYQLIVDSIEFRGAGDLQLAFEKLKRQLAAEGLFDAAHKKNLPFLPRRIALITSPQGAAVHDFIKVAGSRCPAVALDIMPVRVQGEGAADEIVRALDLVNRAGRCEVAVLCRGGGSLEDLQPFNEERVARAIFASSLPVVSAVGHEIDFTVADFVADLRAPTPSAAAELVIPDQRLLRERIANASRRLAQTMTRTLDGGQYRLQRSESGLRAFVATITRSMLVVDSVTGKLAHAQGRLLQRKEQLLARLTSRLARQNPERVLSYQRQLVGKARAQLLAAMLGALRQKWRQTEKQREIIAAVNPLAVLERGYAIVKAADSDILVRQSSQVRRGDQLAVILHQGGLDCTVTSIQQTASPPQPLATTDKPAR